MSKKRFKESLSESSIRDFIGHICNKDFAKANVCLGRAVQEKIKNRIRQSLKETN